MKTSELTGALLDYWVAKAEGLDPCIANDTGGIGRCIIGYFEKFGPSTEWALGGPIIEREKIGTIPWGFEGLWLGSMPGDVDYYVGISYEDGQMGETPLIAAMRAYVASKFGEEVPDDPTVKADRKRNG